jgi:uncharacterized delta-60 repeat protein
MSRHHRWVRLLAFAGSLALVQPPGPAHAGDGDADPEFHGDGIFDFLPPGAWTAFASRILAVPDGDLVALVRSEDQQDPTDFDSWRRITASGAAPSCRIGEGVLSHFVAEDARLDRLGRLVVAGLTGNLTRVAIARFLYPACTLDPDFGVDGITVVDAGELVEKVALVERPSPGPLTNHHLYVAAGRHFGGERDLFLTRLEDDGDVDFTFGGGVGARLIALGLRSFSLADLELDPEGRLLAGITVWLPDEDENFGVLRLLSDGSFDPSLDGVGFREVPMDFVADGNDRLNAIAVAPDGDIALVGDVDSAGLTYRSVGLAVLEESGALETEFASDGIRGLNVGGFVAAFARDAVYRTDGRLLVGGYVRREPTEPGRSDSLAARLLPSGALDGSFGLGGVALIAVDLSTDADDSAFSLALSAGRPVLSGAARTASGIFRAFVARLENRLIFMDGFEGGSTAAW